MPQIPLKVLHQPRPDGPCTNIGRAFSSEKGADIALHYVPLSQGPVLLLLREGEQGTPSNGQGVPFKVLHPRRFKNAQTGQEATAWTTIGQAVMHDQGYDVKLYYAPCAVDGVMRLILREYDARDGRPAQPQSRAQYGGAAAQPQRPQHRDQLAQQPPAPAYVDPDELLPF